MQTMKMDILAKTGRIRFLIKNKRTTVYEGGRRSSQKGRSSEFSGFREYFPGDDMRYVDWNAYGRLDKLYIKEYMEEREGCINILLDSSKSMDFGAPSKEMIMAGLTQAISYIADKSRDSVTVTDLAEPLRTIRIPRGRFGQERLENWLRSRPLDGKVDLTEAIKTASIGKSGLTFIISDFYDEDFLKKKSDLLRYMQFHRQQVVLLHVLSKDELEIEDTGSFRFIDAEAESSELRATLDNLTLEGYLAAMDRFRKDLKQSAEALQCRYYLCRTDHSLEKILLEDLRGLYDI